MSSESINRPSSRSQLPRTILVIWHMKPIDIAPSSQGKKEGDKGDGTRATARTFSGLVKGGSEEYRKDKSLASNSDTSESLYQSGTETSILEVFHPSVRFHVEGTEQDTLHFRRSVDEPMLISTVMR
ncbi:hypothetical protein BLNAU_9619 [Blattamonas nauphoetae]|uniref:Uncharacterized protein n=1 Tax=Blattamonas nauphoetae TaxID=2049346 RepID=A0ABQ9XV78_9EUKA|nr:hypothetical protein BLNAU_9619 [Blattamonas nauphoetae]